MSFAKRNISIAGQTVLKHGSIYLERVELTSPDTTALCEFAVYFHLVLSPSGPPEDSQSGESFKVFLLLEKFIGSCLRSGNIAKSPVPASFPLTLDPGDAIKTQVLRVSLGRGMLTPPFKIDL